MARKPKQQPASQPALELALTPTITYDLPDAMPARPIRPAFRGERLRQRKASYVGGRHCADILAIATAGLTPADVCRVASRLLNLDLAARYAGLNAGQIRMNSVNRLRGACDRGELNPAEVCTEFDACRATQAKAA